MERKKASDFDQELLNLFDQYVHGQIDRRGFLDRAAKFAVGGMTRGHAARCAESGVRRGPAGAEGRPATQDRVGRISVAAGIEQDARLPRAAGERLRQAARHARRPREPRSQPAHRGHRAAARARQLPRVRAGRARARSADIPGDEDKARELFPKLDQAKTREDFVAAAAYLKAPAGVHGQDRRGRILLRRRHREHAGDAAAGSRAAVPFYGNQPSAEDAAKIKAPLLIHYAENDDRINAGWPAFETALKANNVRYTMYRYPGTQHGFNNDTTPRYDQAAAKLAWQRTVDFFNKEVRGAQGAAV